MKLGRRKRGDLGKNNKKGTYGKKGGLKRIRQDLKIIIIKIRRGG